MFYEKILVFPSHGYRFITPIDWKNESSQVYPIIARKIAEYEGIKVCYQILIYDTFLNINFESVSILGHKFSYVSPLYHQQLKDNIGSVIKQFESYAQNNITNNLSHFKYDINNIKLFTNDTFEGMKLYHESLISCDKLFRQSLIERNRIIDDRISDTTHNRFEEKKLLDDISRDVKKHIFERCSGFEACNTTVSDISENGVKADLKKQPLRKENKDKLLNVDREKTWKRI